MVGRLVDGEVDQRWLGRVVLPGCEKDVGGMGKLYGARVEHARVGVVRRGNVEDFVVDERHGGVGFGGRERVGTDGG